jgi:hypothetical protein
VPIRSNLYYSKLTCAVPPECCAAVAVESSFGVPFPERRDYDLFLLI